MHEDDSTNESPDSGSQRPVERARVRTTSKRILAIAAAGFLALLLTLLPGVGRILAEGPLAAAALVEALAAATVVVVLVAAAPTLAAVVRPRIDGPGSFVENCTSVVYWLVVLFAVLVAHRGFADLVRPVLGPAAWLYDAAFLFLALPPVAFVAVRLVAALDPGAELLTDRLVGDADDHGSEG